MPPTKKLKVTARPRTRSTYQLDSQCSHLVTPPFYPSPPTLLIAKQKTGNGSSSSPIFRHPVPTRSPRSSRTIYTPSHCTYPLDKQEISSRLFANHPLRAASSTLNNNNSRRPSYHERIFAPCPTARDSPPPYHTRMVASPSARSRTLINNENASPAYPTYLRDQEDHHSGPFPPRTIPTNRSYNTRSIRVEGEITEWPTGISFIFPTISVSPTLSPFALGFEGGSGPAEDCGWDKHTGREKESDAQGDERSQLWGSTVYTGSKGMDDGSETRTPGLYSSSSSMDTDTSRQSGTPIDTLSKPYRPKPYDLPYPIKDRQEIQRARIGAYLENKDLVKRSIRGSGNALIGGGDLREALVVRQESQDSEMGMDHHSLLSPPTEIEAFTSVPSGSTARRSPSPPRYLSMDSEIVPLICTTKCLCCFGPSSTASPRITAQLNQDGPIQETDHSVWIEDDGLQAVELIDSNEGSEEVVASVEDCNVEVNDDETADKADELYAGLRKRHEEEVSLQAKRDRVAKDSMDDTSTRFEVRKAADMTAQTGAMAVRNTKEKDMGGFEVNAPRLGENGKRTIDFVSVEGIESPQPVNLSRARARTPQASSNSSSAGARTKPSPLKVQVDYPSPTPSPTNMDCQPLSPALTPPSSPCKSQSSFDSDTRPFTSTEYVARPLEPVYQDQVKTATILNRMESEMAMANIWNRPAPPLDEAEWEIMVQCIRERKIRAEMEKRRRKEAESLRKFTSARARMAKLRAETLNNGLADDTNASSLRRTAREETRLFVQDISKKRYLSRRWPSTISTLSGRDRQVPMDSRTLQKDQRPPKADDSVRQKRRPQPLTLVLAPQQHRLDVPEPTLHAKVGDTILSITQEASDTESELTPLPEDEELQDSA